MHSLGIMTLDAMLPQIGEGRSIIFEGTGIRTGSLRMQTFKYKGCDCVVCGAKGEHFSIECSVKTNRGTGVKRPMNNWHANLYGRVRPTSELILMTHDHIWPLSMGGYNTLKNSITMCTRCNNNKGSKLPSQEFIEKYGCAYDPDRLSQAILAQAGRPPQQKKVRSLEEIAEKEQRRQEWLATPQGQQWLHTSAGKKYLATLSL